MNRSLSPKLFSLWPDSSPRLALVELCDKISTACDRKEHTIGVFLDLSTAFDTVNHDVLSNKLEHCCSGLPPEWVKVASPIGHSLSNSTTTGLPLRRFLWATSRLNSWSFDFYPVRQWFNFMSSSLKQSCLLTTQTYLSPTVTLLPNQYIT